VDREKLLRISGRGRSRQIALAKKYGITDIPAPAGGCILADPILSKRIAEVYARESILQTTEISVTDIRLLLVGRQFILPGGGWLVVGRDEKDNIKLEKLVQADDAVLQMEEWAGPLAVLKKAGSRYPNREVLDRDLERAASLVVRYGKKLPDGVSRGDVTCILGTTRRLLRALPLDDDVFQEWALR
jgi:hypothetical protein